MIKYRIVNKYRFFTTISLMLLLLFISMFFIVVNAKSTSTEILVPIYVNEGDSLWKLADKYCDESKDIRSYIDRIITINNLSDSNIMPGELLMFPQIAEK
ncbi:MAG: LysM peptidoglycan-binding domain-containing protein [Lutisporaceae bacterium]